MTKLERLIAAIENPYTPTFAADEEMIEVSQPASSAATAYERVRVAVDYQEDHLWRRNAILRILKRLAGSELTSTQIVETLLQELIWAKYLPNDKVPKRLVSGIAPIVDKYGVLLRSAETDEDSEYAINWILEVLSTEIEYYLAPPTVEEALASYAYEELRERIEWDPKLGLKEDERDLYLYIAVHQMLLKSNVATLRFRVLTLYYPKWPGAGKDELMGTISGRFSELIRFIDEQINHEMTQKLVVRLRRKSGVFKVMRDVFEANPGKFDELRDDPALLDKEVKKALGKRTAEFHERLRRAVSRTIIFLFITKIFMAFLIEVPYELLIVQKGHWTPLLVNVIFHPIFFAIIGFTVRVNEKKNTEDYLLAIRSLMVDVKHSLLAIRMRKTTFGTLSKIFSVIYAMTFLFVYGVIAFALTQIDFTWVSIIEFLFFLSLITFFGIRVRSAERDIVLSDARKGWVGTLFDFLLLPLVRAGQWLSIKVSKINVFIYFFDFILEAPVKVAIRFFENWISFVREKREEI